LKVAIEGERQLKESAVPRSNPCADLRDNLRSATAEPLLPVEKKLILWSLTIGATLLVALAALNHFLAMT
jgi:hypothetical protein